MIRCKKCVMPDTAPNITLNNDGICNHCKAEEEYKKTDWKKRWIELNQLCHNHRRKDGYYDCLIAVSGGKDSHFQVGLFKEKLGMNPLCISLDNTSWTETGRDNFKNLNERYDVDILTFSPHRRTLIKNIKKNFEESLHPMKYWDELLYKLPSKIGLKFGIYLIIWGEDTQWRNIPDASILHGKERLFQQEIFTSYYVPWNREDNYIYAKHNGFKPLTDWHREGLEGWEYEQVDTIGYLINQYCKFIKFGYSNQTENCSDAIRNGIMTRKQAIEMVRLFDWKSDGQMLEDFQNLIKITPKEFWDIIDEFANTEILEKRDGEWRLKENGNKM